MPAEVPADVKAKVKKVVSGHAAGVKGADFPREWEKHFAKPLKDTWTKLGFKKMAIFLSACSDVIRHEEDGSPGNIKYYPMDQRIATLEAKCKEMEGKPAAAQDVRRKPDAKQHPCNPATTANQHLVKNSSVQTVAAAAEPKGAPTRPSSSPRSLPQLVFGTCYHFGRGSPRKAQQRVSQRDGCEELPYDDAFGATRQCLVLCDGVGGGGAASGRWARLCVKECLAQAEKISGLNGIDQLQRPGDAPKNAAGEIVAGAMKSLTTTPGFENSHATTTLLAVHLVAGKNGKGEAMLKIDACEIGDSRWALLCWNATGRRYVCTYLADA